MKNSNFAKGHLPPPNAKKITAIYQPAQVRESVVVLGLYFYLAFVYIWATATGHLAV